MKAGLRILALAGVLSLVAACSQQSASGPPTVRYGQDACADCGMILSDDRFAAALINPAPDSVPLLFDDVGCLLEYQHKHSEATGWTHYFHDADTHQWIRQDQAFFVQTSQETPMGSGIFAFGSHASADAFAQNSKAAVQSYAQLAGCNPIATAASR